MTPELFWLFGFNILINSLFSFYTTFFLVVVGAFILRIKDPRTQSFVMLIPFIKLVFDFFLYDFSKWSAIHHMNPLEAEAGTRFFSLSLCNLSLSNYFPLSTGIGFTIAQDKTFTLADLLGTCIGLLGVKIATLTALTISLGLLVKCFLHIFNSLRKFYNVISLSTMSDRPIYNHGLNYRLLKTRTRIVVASTLEAPCAFGCVRKTIIFPERLLNLLSQEEYEAIIAHELNHLQWNDSLVRLVVSIITTLFWWIPSSWCKKRLEHLQEVACDKNVARYQISSSDLALALLKTINFCKASIESCEAPITPFALRKTALKRIQLMLQDLNGCCFGRYRWIQLFFLGVFIGTIFLGKLWIF